MAEFRMPSLGADMDRGTLLEWRVAPGDPVTRGDIIAVIDTDKSDIEVEVFESGIVEELLVSEGTEVAVGTPLARIGTTVPAAVPAPAQVAAPAPPTKSPASEVTEPVSARADSGSPSAGHDRTFSPLVRHRADELGIDLATIVGTGTDGVITRDDVERAAAPRPEPGPTAGASAPPSPVPAATPPGRGQRSDARAPGTRSSPLARRLAADQGIDVASITGTGPEGAVIAADIHPAEPTTTSEPGPATDPMPPAGPTTTPEPGAHPRPKRPTRQQSIRQSVARLMARSKREIPHYYLSTTIDLAPAMTWLTATNADRSVTERILPAALLLKATAVAARQVPEMNGHWIDDAFVPADRVDLGVAVSLRGGGLLAPAIGRADELTVDELMAGLRDLVTRARAGTLTSSEMSDPSLTVTNLGDQGVEAVFGVIYPPQVALVGFGKIVDRPWAAGGMLGIHPCVTATLSADHRASDGHRGATMLATIDRLLADPDSL